MTFTKTNIPPHSIVTETSKRLTRALWHRRVPGRVYYEASRQTYVYVDDDGGAWDMGNDAAKLRRRIRDGEVFA